jgi:Zn-dependent protease with chaperone function
MMALGLIPFAVSVLLALASGGLARHLSPRVAAPLLTLLALATSLATGLVLSLAAFSALARDALVAAAGGWSRAGDRPWDEVPAGFGIVAAVVVATLLAGAAVYLVRAAVELVQARRACRGLTPGPGGLVITRDDQPTAYTVPRQPGVIVVSTGMLRLLRPDERRAVLAHEAAHLRYYHAVYLLGSRLAAAANPLLRPLARNVRLAVELWADQVAAQEVGDPRIVAQALARASLATTTGPATTSPTAGLSLAAAQSDVGQRVRALLGPSQRPRPWAMALALALTVASGAAALTLTWTTHQQIEVAQLASAHAAGRVHAGQAHQVNVPGARRSL